MWPLEHENPAFEGVSLDYHKKNKIKPIHVLIVWCVAVVKGLSVHVCQFRIEGSGKEGPGTSFGQILKRKLPSQIT